MPETGCSLKSLLLRRPLLTARQCPNARMPGAVVGDQRQRCHGQERHRCNNRGRAVINRSHWHKSPRVLHDSPSQTVRCAEMNQLDDSSFTIRQIQRERLRRWLDRLHVRRDRKGPEKLRPRWRQRVRPDRRKNLRNFSSACQDGRKKPSHAEKQDDEAFAFHGAFPYS